MTSNYKADDPILGQIDLDDYFITDAWLIDQFVGNALWSWGYNSNLAGNLGLGDRTHRSSPVQVGSLTNWKSLATKTLWYLPAAGAIKTDGTLWTWGENIDGGLGLGNTVSRSSPVQVGSLTNWKQISFGAYHTTAIKTDGSLWAWGHAPLGALGLGDINDRSSPVQVGLLYDWKLVSAGGYHTLAIKNDGSLWAWGGYFTVQSKNAGQLGLGDRTQRSSPVQVGSLTNWKLVSGGGYHTAAIKTDGTLWSWGYNFDGELGLNDVTSRSSPVQVGSLTNWKQVKCGGYGNTAAIKTDGTLWTWGYNGGGELGLSDRTHRSSPVQVGSLTNWKEVSVGSSHSQSIKTDGTLWAWGLNTTGSLGLGDRTQRSSPVQVGSLTNWKEVQVGDADTMALYYADIV